MESTVEATTSLLRIGAIVTNKRPASSARPMVQQSSNGSVVVALIDTGCDVTNTDLNVVGGMDFTTDSSYGLDGNGHGTHVAGKGGFDQLATCHISTLIHRHCAADASRSFC